ncbi:glycerophosphocholine phosphodiesterase GPCPD1-like [Paramacrobiotus metropolitanus]|uniref:glycerophosphocholine phosphodiesterase GPCPD1-like n=1 Tax=Paramacrobiotus metropolitanus TaxID=2943436 RepID=UPI002446031B|nr:glycerophosphocholine phosphodiesterase GPCPD1-like [Paramacrobiotus metropolitanus]XP_055339938.1 glycerophosphocholine phosphodiesterase GPCPD1-like [Paramacrobiotus metropolitanus]
MALSHVHFVVKASTRPDELVFLSGDVRELGSWNPEDSVALSKQESVQVENDGQHSIWTANVALPTSRDVRYRYFIGKYGELPGKRVVMVLTYESHLVPRRLTTVPTNGKPQDASPDQYTTFGLLDGKDHTMRGWLTHECEIHLRFLPNAIHWWKARHRTKAHSLKIIPMDLRYRENSPNEDEDDLSSPFANDIEIAVLNETECTFRPQKKFGHVFKPDETAFFRMRVLEPNFMAYRCDFYAFEPGTENLVESPDPRPVGCCYILPTNVKESDGDRTVVINGLKHQPIGQLFAHYMLVHPTRNLGCSLEVSYAKYWRRRKFGFDIGHRGSGNSFSMTTQCAAIRENTIASLVSAASHGADFVEFDVQLSKDKVPVIYHDFSVFITMRRRRGSGDSTSSVSSVGSNGEDYLGELHEMPVKDLTLKQLQMLKLNHVTEKDGFSKYNGADDHEPFPSLEKALRVLDVHVGFNVEVKFPMLFKDGKHESEHFFERNEFVDLILQVIYRHAGNRRIIFSCFEPDVCAMLRVKQNKYPVSFLSHGEITLWPTPLDARAQTTRNVVLTAIAYDLLGVNVHTQNLLKNEWLIHEAKEHGLVVIVWGDDNNDPRLIQQLKEMGVDGVIYDRIEEFKADRDNVFHLEYRAKRALLDQLNYDTVSTSSTIP